MKSSFCGLALIAFSSAAVLTSAEEHPESARFVSIHSSAVLADIGDHDQNSGSRVIEKQSNLDRIDMREVGTTFMDGATLNEAAGRKAPGLIRSEGLSKTHREERGEAASHLEEEEVVARHDSQRHKAKRSKLSANRTKAVSWAACDQGECKCFSRRRVVIRYQRERSGGSYGDQANEMTNWHFRAGSRPYTTTPTGEFSKGFLTGATNLQQCGGDHAWAKDCLQQPVACTFDNGADSTNPYDAKAGQYCCDSSLEYCSYKCEADETFKCPTLTTDINFPGGMDPAGPAVYKRCYMAQYPHGMNPESASDADTDIGGLAD